MPSSRIPSPARSQGVISTPRKHTPRRSRSVCSAKSNKSTRLTAIISDSFKLSPMPNRQSVLNDDTDIEVPGCNSWWKKLGENSRDVMEVLESKDIAEVNNVAEEFDVEILSQEKKNYTLDLPESSDGESINSIVIPQRKLFTQKENQAQKKFGQLIDNRETLAKLQKSHFDQEKDIDVGPKNLFSQVSKPRTKPAFPAALLNISSKAVNKTKEMPAPEVKGQVRNLFGNRPGMKRKNMFADFIVSESEDEIPDIQPKVFGFQKNTQKRRESSASRGVGHSPTSSIDLELDEWKLLPSSTMVENQLEEATTPVKRARLSKLVETKESETTNVNSTANKTKQSNKSVTSKNKSKTASNSKIKENIENDLNPASKTKDDLIVSQNNQSLNSSSMRVTRNKSKSIRESSFKESDSKLHNKSKNKTQSKQNISVKALVHASDQDTKQDTEKTTETNLLQNEDEIQNISTEQVPGDDDEDFTLEYENDDEQIMEPITTNIDNINNDKKKSSPSKTNNDANITTSKVKQAENKSSENNDLPETVTETSKDITNKNNKKMSPKQKDRDEQDDVDAHIERQAQHNKEQNQHKSLVKDSDKIQNKSKQEKEINTSQNTEKQKDKNLTIDKDIQQTTKTDAQIEKENNHKIDSEHKDEVVNKDNEEQNVNDDVKMPNESKHSSDSVQNNQNISIAEASIEVEEDENEQSQNKTQESENEEQNDQEEIENETEDQSDQNESEKVNSDAEEQNESSEEKTEEQQNESIEVNEEENDEESEVENQDESEEETDEKSEVENQDEDETGHKTEIEDQNESDNEEMDEENETENKNDSENNDDEEDNEEEGIENEAESENADSDDNVQNESNLSVNENEQEDEAIESDQEQNDNDNEDNEVPENKVTDKTSNGNDTTGRHRKKDVTVKSPEAILHDKTNQIESFMAQGRSTSVRKTKSIIRNLNIRPSLAPVRESTGLSDGTRDSSAEGSGWDSHRTTRKTIRLTLGKDFTPRKSLRALVMEKSAKRNTNFNEVVADITKAPQANSTELPAFDSYHDPDPVQVDETNETDEPSEHEKQDDERNEPSDHEVDEANDEPSDHEVDETDEPTEQEVDETNDEPSDHEMQANETNEPSVHELSARTRQTTLEMYLQKIKNENLEKKRKMEEQIRASLKAPTRDTFNYFKVPLKPVKRIKPMQNKPKPKQMKSSVIPLDMLPSEVLEDMKYKPPKRFQPSNASWITKRLYKFLESKLEPKYDYKARVRAERLVELIYSFTREVRRGPNELAVDTLKKEMARLDVVKTHFDFYQFFHEFMPREIRVKVVPDVVNKISLPRNGVFSDIIT